MRGSLTITTASGNSRRPWYPIHMVIIFVLGLFGGFVIRRETNLMAVFFLGNASNFHGTTIREMQSVSDSSLMATTTTTTIATEQSIDDTTTMEDGHQHQHQQQAATTASVAYLCHENPYKDSLLEGHTFATADEKATNWMANKSNIRNALYYETHDKTIHAKFDAFEVMAPCHYNCTGRCRDDNSKIACGLDHLQEGCIIYSIGGNNNWEFEENLYNMTPCFIHTFDCTGEKTRFQPPERISDRHTFHHICLATEAKSIPETLDWQGRAKWTIYGAMETLHGMQAMLNHTRLDLLKMDIEGFEWGIFDSWPELTDIAGSSKVSLPMQILVEIHYSTQMKDLKPQQPGVPFKTEIELVQLQEHLLKMGYVVAVRDDNRFCPHCTELTLLRHKCL